MAGGGRETEVVLSELCRCCEPVSMGLSERCEGRSRTIEWPGNGNKLSYLSLER